MEVHHKAVSESFAPLLARGPVTLAEHGESTLDLVVEP